jgi:hypothetical protein
MNRGDLTEYMGRTGSSASPRVGSPAGGSGREMEKEKKNVSGLPIVVLDRK